MMCPDDCTVDHLQTGITATRVIESVEDQLPQARQCPTPELAITLDHLPKYSGRSRQATPVRAIQKIPSRTRRWFFGRLPLPAPRETANGSRQAHSLSLNKPRITVASCKAAFVANMEDVLEVYQRPHNLQRPVVCLDETSKQMIIERRAPIPAQPGRKARHDYEYRRNGVANLFMLFAPLEGWRHVKVTDRHTAVDYAHTLRVLSDVLFPGASKIVLVQDNLNTHKPASLYEAFPAPEVWPASSSGSNGTSRQSMAVGSIWQNLNSVFSQPNVWIVASPTN
jgi:hypothetical protein